VLIEESEDHQMVKVEDPQNKYGSLNFELTDEAYESIEGNLDKENLHTQKNIDLIETGEPPEGGLKQQFPKVASNYDNEIRNTLEPMKISPGDLTDLKTNFYGEEDAKKTFTSKDVFVEEVEKAYPGEEGKDPIIRSSILRNTLNNNAKQRRTKILGDQISITEGSHKLAAISGDVKIDMTDQGVYIDAGEGRDVTIKCRKFHLKNEDEDNITYGDDYAAHFGSNEEYFYGKSDEYFYGDKYEEHHGTVDEHFRGDKLETFHGSSGEWYLGHKIEGLLGPAESFSVAQTLEMYLGLKEEFSFIFAFELFAGLKTEINAGMMTEATFGCKFEINRGIEIKNGDLDTDWHLTKIGKAAFFLSTAGLSLMG